jgi:hypothetical protein
MAQESGKLEQLSPRLEQLRSGLAQRIPCETLAARQELEGKQLTDLLIAYLTWQARLIRPRPRDVVIWPEVLNSPHYAQYKGSIADIRREFETGQDMNCRLSDLAHKRTYSGSPPQPASMPREQWLKAFWRDKDRTRVTLDAHHLHMGQRNLQGTVGRTGPLLFVGITTDTAVFLTIGDHNSFDDGTISMLMATHLNAADVGSAPAGGALLPGPGITLGGTQIKDTFGAIDLAKALKAVDRELTEAGFPNPAQKEIHMDFDDVVVIDTAAGTEERRVPGRL